jgi:hypothetical protein
MAQIQWLCGQSSGLALKLFPSHGCPAIANPSIGKHPLQRFGVDLAVFFHLIGWHGLLAIDQFCVVALATKHAVIVDPVFIIIHHNNPSTQCNTVIPA